MRGITVMAEKMWASQGPSSMDLVDWFSWLVCWILGWLVGWLVSLLADYWLVTHLVCYLTALSAAEFIHHRWWMNEYDALVERYWHRENRSTGRKQCPSATSSTVNPTWVV
jgi:hypothetical protein